MMCSKPIFCSKIATERQKLLDVAKKMLQMPKVAQKLPSTIGKG